MAFSKKINIDKKDIDLSQTELKSVIELCNEWEQYVLIRKYWLAWKVAPMQQIWNEFDMSRERIRQIMNKSLNKVRRFITHNEELNSLLIKVHKMIKESWSIVWEKQIIDRLIKSKSTKLSYNEILLVLSSDYDLYHVHRNRRFDKIFFMEPLFESLINDINETSIDILKNNKESVDKTSLVEKLVDIFSNKFERNESLKKLLLKPNLYENIFSLSRHIYEFDGKMWLSDNKEANPKTMKLKIYHVLSSLGKSMHYEEIAKLVKEKFKLKSIKVPTIHNELVKWKEFVNVWMWTYWLRKWWFKWENTIETIVAILKEAWRPMKVSEITKEVLKERKIREITVLIVLQKNSDIFKREGKWTYWLK